MNKFLFSGVCALILFASAASGQDMSYIKRNIKTLSGSGFGGRGYVAGGNDKAARFTARMFNELKLSAFESAPDMFQPYRFNVNTFPGAMELRLGKKQLRPGLDFLIDARSTGFVSREKVKVDKINLMKIKDSSEWDRVRGRFFKEDVYLLQHADSFAKRMKMSLNSFVASLPEACYIIPRKDKLIWTVAQTSMPATVFYVADTSVPHGKKVAVRVVNKMLNQAVSKNVAAYVPGTKYADSFIVFTAHFDHLGKMGTRTVFPGANDNASGTAFVLALAQYFKVHPQAYSIAFLMFSGEEAGLMGSSYYCAHPVFPPEQIKCLVNIDLMGDASDGITIVNGLQQSGITAQLRNLNDKLKLLPEIKVRDNAQNSDHYPFTQIGVPAIFIYANGGKGFYHDVFDKAETLSLKNIPEVFRLITQFTEQQK